MNFSLIFLAASLLASPIMGHAFNSCPSSNTLHVDSVQLNPDPPRSGESLEFNISGTTSSDVVGGNAHLTIYALSVPVAQLDFDVCSDLGWACPLASGESFHGSIQYALPAQIPKGFKVQAKLEFSLDDAQPSTVPVGCVEFDMSIGTNWRSLREKSIVPIVTDEFQSWLYNAWLSYLVDYGDMHAWTVSLSNVIDKYKHEAYYNFIQHTYHIVNHNYNLNSTYELGHNEFSYLKYPAFRDSYYPSYRPRPKVRVWTSNPNTHDDLVDLPDQVDWRSQGAVTPIKNQGQCGSCWSFSTTGALEGVYQIKYKRQVTFSEQELVSCDKVDQGCNGGEMDDAFDFIHRNGGLCTEKSYPYTSSQGNNAPCKKTCLSVKNSTVRSHVDVQPTTRSLMEAVAKNPVSIAIEADRIGFQLYSSGVYSGNCGTNLDHGVLLVGYGEDPNGEEYWLVKNSWGETWGDGGYIKIKRDSSGNSDEAGGECGILLSASYPVL